MTQDAPTRDPDDATMSFGDHLEELRTRILLAVVPALPLAIILFLVSNTFLRVLLLPLGRVLAAKNLPPDIQVLAPPELIVVKLKLSVVVALVAIAPWILWQAWLFIRPGLHEEERRFVHFLFPGSAVLTIAGAALLYFVMLPLVLTVLVGVGVDLDLDLPAPEMPAEVQRIADDDRPRIPVDNLPEAPELGRMYWHLPTGQRYAAVVGEDGLPTLAEVPRPSGGGVVQEFQLKTYVNFVLLLLVGVAVAFQMPLVILLLGWLGLASPDWLASNRRYALLACGVASALLTPADVVSMLVLLLPLYGLYELGIVLLRIAPAGRVAKGAVLRRPDKTQSR